MPRALLVGPDLSRYHRSVTAMHTRVRAICVITAIAAVVLVAAPLAQQPAPSVTFQVEVNFVDIDAVVTDERGNFVAGLGKDDFELFEDGKPQEISTFSLVDIPLPSARRRPAPPQCRPSADVRSNAQPISGRLYVIVLDDLNVAPLRSKVVVQAARQFIERNFGPERHGGDHVYERANGCRAGVHIGAGAAPGRDRQVPGTQAALDRDRESRSVLPTASERARDQRAGHDRSGLRPAGSDDPARSVGRSASPISRPMPTTSSAAIARSRCWARCGGLPTYMGASVDAARRC